MIFDLSYLLVVGINPCLTRRFLSSPLAFCHILPYQSKVYQHPLTTHPMMKLFQLELITSYFVDDTLLFHWFTITAVLRTNAASHDHLDVVSFLLKYKLRTVGIHISIYVTPPTTMKILKSLCV